MNKCTLLIWKVTYAIVVSIMVTAVIIYFTVLYGTTEVFGQTFVEDYFGPGQPAEGIDVSDPQTPELPEFIAPAPPLLCGMGDAPEGGAGCDPVNNWWCSPETACMGTANLAVAEVMAPSYLSGLNPPQPQPWRDHWRASKADRDAWKARALECEDYLLPTPTPTPTPTPVPDCEDFVDGSGGRVWKPVADSGGRVVFLMERGWDEWNPVITGASVVRKQFSNGARPTFWLDKYADDLPSYTIVQFESICLVVPDPTKRYD